MQALTVPLSRTMLVKERDLFLDAEAEPVKSARQLFDLMRETANAEAVECAWVVLMDARRKPLQVVLVGMGTLTQCLMHPRDIFRAAIHANAAGVAVIHNHPSGDPQASPDDHAVTARLREAGSLLAVPLMDHVIIGAETYYSYAEQGWPR